MTKKYIQPQFEFVRIDESNKVFIAASETPVAPSFSSGSLGSITKTTGSWQ